MKAHEYRAIQRALETATKNYDLKSLKPRQIRGIAARAVTIAQIRAGRTYNPVLQRQALAYALKKTYEHVQKSRY
jgi:hypothetical protein